jgi:hypothetical protein
VTGQLFVELCGQIRRLPELKVVVCVGNALLCQ